ncbi:MAG: hypothetical protein QG656_2284 [Candidatus Hydrogenedentes bacterium]|nr:hypothetical protein [Candidatus Hydrogenedentota bacterium]
MTDPFVDIARYYNPIMDHVNYDRWVTAASAIATMLPPGFRHLDAACGTGTLLRLLRRGGWDSIGMDLSYSMLNEGNRTGRPLPVAAADLRALPLHESVDFITSLFDSMNFLLDMNDFCMALRSLHAALRPGGLLYFDVVTERMIFDHYDGQTWTEDNGQFNSTWKNHYDRYTRVITTDIRVNTGDSCRLLERIYPIADIEEALSDSGFYLLGAHDAHTWKSPNRKTVRVDLVASKGNEKMYRKAFKKVRAEIKKSLR